MTLDLTWTGPALALTSGVLILLMGLPLVRVRSRHADALAFGTFCLVWGIQIVTGNVARLVGPGPRAVPWIFFFVASTVVLYVPLAYFASTFTTPRGAFARPGPLLALLAPAAVGTLVLGLSPSTFFRGFSPSGATLFGPAYALASALLFAAFAYALVALAREHARAPEGSLAQRRARLVLVALLLYVAYVAARALAPLALRLPEGPEWILPLSAAAAGVVAGVVSIATARRLRTRRARVTLVAAVLVPASLGGAIVAGLDVAGLVRAATVALIAFAILRYELFDLDARVKRGAIAVAVFFALAIVSLGLEQVLEVAIGSAGVAITLTQVVVLGGAGIALAACFLGSTPPNVSTRAASRCTRPRWPKPRRPKASARTPRSSRTCAHALASATRSTRCSRASSRGLRTQTRRRRRARGSQDDITS